MEEMGQQRQTLWEITVLNRARSFRVSGAKRRGRKALCPIANISEETIDSILRRRFVSVIKGRFVSADAYRDLLRDRSDTSLPPEGIFVKNFDLSGRPKGSQAGAYFLLESRRGNSWFYNDGPYLGNRRNSEARRGYFATCPGCVQFASFRPSLSFCRSA